MPNLTTSARIAWFDEWRGVMIFNMILYHLFYDLVNFYGISFSWFNGMPGELWQEIIACTFILIAGACSWYSKNNLKRGLRLLGLGCLLTLITYLALPEFVISFGILHLLGVSMILFLPLRRSLAEIPAGIGLGLFAGLYLLTVKVSQGYLGFGFYPVAALPQVLYQTNFLYMLGLPSEQYYSADYFPLIPYFFMFLAGSFLGQLHCLGRLPVMITKERSSFWAFLGQHSLIIYLVHQPILLGILWLIF